MPARALVEDWAMSGGVALVETGKTLKMTLWRMGHPGNSGRSGEPEGGTLLASCSANPFTGPGEAVPVTTEAMIINSIKHRKPWRGLDGASEPIPEIGCEPVL